MKTTIMISILTLLAVVIMIVLTDKYNILYVAITFCAYVKQSILTLH